MNKKIILIGLGSFLVVAGLVGGGYYAVASREAEAKRAQAELERNTLRYKVVGTSMDPTVKEGDWLEVRTDVKEFHRQDVVIFRLPADESKVLCRRILGLPGDMVVTSYYANVKTTTVINEKSPSGVVFPASTTPKGQEYSHQEITVPPGMVYVAGDNTVPKGSYDSDEWGLLPVENIAGVVRSRIEPDPRQF